MNTLRDLALIERQREVVEGALAAAKRSIALGVSQGVNMDDARDALADLLLVVAKLDDDIAAKRLAAGLTARPSATPTRAVDSAITAHLDAVGLDR